MARIAQPTLVAIVNVDLSVVGLLFPSNKHQGLLQKMDRMGQNGLC